MRHSALLTGVVCRYTVKCTAPFIWKPNTVQLAALKANNAASFFEFDSLKESPLRLIWRMRWYPKEKMLAPAKPLWVLPAGGLRLLKGQCRRLV